MALDRLGWPSNRDRFNDIWIERPLSQKSNPFDLLRFFFKDLNKEFADRFSLRFRILDSFQSGEESLRGIHGSQVEMKMFLKIFLHLLSFIQTKKSGIYKNGCYIFPDRFVQKERY